VQSIAACARHRAVIAAVSREGASLLGAMRFVKRATEHSVSKTESGIENRKPATLAGVTSAGEVGAVAASRVVVPEERE